MREGKTVEAGFAEGAGGNWVNCDIGFGFACVREMWEAKRLVGERKLRKWLDATTLWESPKILLVMVSFMNTLGSSIVSSYLFKYQCSCCCTGIL